MTPQEYLPMYKERGYDAVVVTDHYHQKWFEAQEIVKKDAVEEYFKGYEELHAYGEQIGVRVLYGAEVRFAENGNDYLIYGFEKAFLNDPAAIFQMGAAAFSKRCRDENVFFMQAHPFRDGCVPADPRLLDAVEATNMNPRHNNHNDLAHAFAQANHLTETCGSDCHRLEDRCRAAILSQTLPKDTFELAALLRAGNFSQYFDKELIEQNV